MLMAIWTLRCYHGNTGQDEIDVWLSGLQKAARAKFLARMAGLRDQPQHNWNGTRTKQLNGYDGLLEVRFKANNVQHRPIGFFGPDKMEFTLLVGAIEKNNQFIPKSAPDTAIARKKKVLADKRRAHVCDF